MFALLLLGCPTPVSKPPPEVDTACDPVSWYKDTDGDGVGDATRGTSLACEPPEGYAAEDGDCDDLDDAIHPGVDEKCDGVDQDCDGAVDEDPIDATAWYADGDGDGIGAGDGVRTCESPTGTVADGGDCDDTDPTVRPGASERCGGGDENCDGAVDEAGATGEPSWFADTDADGYGDPDVMRTACVAPAGFVADTADCDDTSADVSPDGVESCDGRDQDCDGETDEGTPADSATWYADHDADGYGDATNPTLACAAPDGFTADTADCDDTSADVSPGAAEVCNDVDDDCDARVDTDAVDGLTWYADADSDGYGDLSVTHVSCVAPAGFLADASDCDDTSADVSPAAAETCDPRDEDCDGSTSAGAVDAPTWYADADSDGYGDPLATHVSCVAPAGHVSDATDCDDADPTISPGAPETCSSPADDDCDGTADEDDAIDAVSWYRDADIDGRGDPSVVAYACDRPYGYVTDSLDCDDADSDAHLGAPELCADPGDEDCDGDDNDVGALDCSYFYVDADGDQDGDPTAFVCQCITDTTYTVSTASDCDDADATIYSDASELWADGIDQDCDGRVDVADMTEIASTWTGVNWADQAGLALAAPGDVDGDGRPDLLVSAPYASGELGAVYLLLDPATGGSLGAADYTLEGSTRFGELGHTISAGDADGDGAVDLLAGAPGNTNGVVYLDLAIGSGTTAASDADIVLDGASGEYLGRGAQFLGDLDDDGDDEWGVADVDVYYVYSDVLPGTLSTADATRALTGGTTSVSDLTGTALGDVDGDGIDDFAVSSGAWAVPNPYAGAVFVYFSAPALGSEPLTSSADIALYGSRDTQFGGSTSAAGDCDGDGLGDLVVGAPPVFTSLAGASYVYTNVGAVTSSNDAVTTYQGPSSGYLGTAVAGVGDVDGDGAADLALTETFGYGLGAVHLSFGCPTGVIDIGDASATLEGIAGSGFGATVVGTGDLDGDGYDDLAAGASDADFQTGWVWVVLGR